MIATPELLIGLLVVLLVVTLALFAFLVRGLRRKKSDKAHPGTSRGGVTSADMVTSPAEGELPSQEGALPETYAEPVFIPSSAMPRNEPDDAAPRPAQVTPIQEPASTPEPKGVTLMRVWQDPDGVLMVEVEGQSYRRLFDISDGAVGRRVLETIQRLSAFSKGQESRVAPVEPRATTPSMSPLATEATDAVIAELPQDIFEQLREGSVRQPNLSRVSVDPIPLRGRSVAQDLGLTLNLADEIEQVLQARVKALPEMSQRFIHVRGAPDGGLVFDVDGARYTAVDEIPDVQVTELIQAAIKEWETRR